MDVSSGPESVDLILEEFLFQVNSWLVTRLIEHIVESTGISHDISDILEDFVDFRYLLVKSVAGIISDKDLEKVKELGSNWEGILVESLLNVLRIETLLHIVKAP